MIKILILGILALILIAAFWSILRWVLIIAGAALAVITLVIYFSKENQEELKKQAIEGPALPETRTEPLYKPKNFKQETVATLNNPQELRMIITPEESYCLKEGKRVELPGMTGLLTEPVQILPEKTESPSIYVSGDGVLTQEELERLELADLIRTVREIFPDEKAKPHLEQIGVTYEALLEEGIDVPDIIEDHLRKLLLQYADLKRQEKRTEREEQMLATIDDGLDTVQEALENLYDRNVSRKAIEIESEIAAMEMKLRADGLLDSEFESDPGSKTS